MIMNTLILNIVYEPAIQKLLALVYRDVLLQKRTIKRSDDAD
jgi:hypothetical protein